MALNKHRLLAKKMEQMKLEIEEHFKKVDKQLDHVQFYFHEKFYLCGRPFIKEKAFNTMIKAHFLGMISYSPNQDIQEECVKKGAIGLFLKKHFYLRSESYESASGVEINDKWWIPWGVSTRLTSDNKNLKIMSRLQAFIYCPAPSELGLISSWLEHEMRASSFCYQLIEIRDEYRDQKRLKQNLLQPAYPCYERIVKLWRKRKYTNDMVPKSETDAPFHTDFAPHKNETLGQAYKRARISTSDRIYRNYQGLRNLWMRRLKRNIVRRLEWSERRCNAFYDEWDGRLLGVKNTHYSEKKESRPQGKGIDYQTAGRYISYFTDEFIKNPRKKNFGEAACILWICIHAASEGFSDKATLQLIKTLSSQQLDVENCTISLDDTIIEISEGLTSLLKILLGEGEGKRKNKLFKNITLDQLRDMVKKASKVLNPDKPIDISPEAFLVFPHIFEGIRMNKKEREASRVEEHEVKHYLYPKTKDIAEHLKKLQDPCKTLR